MALEKPLASQKCSFEQTVFFYSFIGICRAGRVETAVVAKEGRDEQLVTSYQE